MAEDDKPSDEEFVEHLEALSLQDRDDETADEWDAVDDWDAPGAVPQLRHANKTPPISGSSSANDAVADVATQPVQLQPGSAADEHAANAQHPTPLREVAFEGGHIIEFYGLSSTCTSTDLEAWLQKVDHGKLPAVVRHRSQPVACRPSSWRRRHRGQQPTRLWPAGSSAARWACGACATGRTRLLWRSSSGRRRNGGGCGRSSWAQHGMQSELAAPVGGGGQLSRRSDCQQYCMSQLWFSTTQIRCTMRETSVTSIRS